MSTPSASSAVDVRRPMKHARGADEDHGHGEEGEEEDDEEHARPQKRHFRTRAHSNVLNANDFWYPASPAEVPVSRYYPKLAAEGVSPPPQIAFVDVGCGYGSLLLGLAAIFPDDLMLGIEIRPKIVEYVQKRVLALRHEARTGKVAHEGAAANSVVLSAAAVATAADAADSVAMPSCENVWAVHNNAMRFLPNFFDKGQLTKLFFCFPDPHFKRKNHRKRVISTALLAECAEAARRPGHAPSPALRAASSHALRRARAGMRTRWPRRAASTRSPTCRS
jgi:tRNA G46 methylase TrmB